MGSTKHRPVRQEDFSELCVRWTKREECGGGGRGTDQETLGGKFVALWPLVGCRGWRMQGEVLGEISLVFPMLYL